MGRCIKWLVAAGAVLVAATGANARPVLSNSLPDPLNFRDQGEWGALAACPPDGPCDVGYTIGIDSRDDRRERRVTSRQDLFNGEFAILLASSAPSLDTNHAFLLPDAAAGPGSSTDYRNGPSIVVTLPPAAGTPPGIVVRTPLVAGTPAAIVVPAVDQAVPEPVTFVLAGIGLAALAFRRRALPRA